MLMIRSRSTNIPYSQKYWQELNLAVGGKIAIAKVLADLNLLFGGSVKGSLLADFNLAVAKV